MNTLETSNLQGTGDASYSESTKRSGLSHEAELKWLQFKDFETDEDFIRACNRADPDDFGRIKRHYMLRQAMFGSLYPLSRKVSLAYKSLINSEMSGFDVSEKAQIESICTIARNSMPYSDVDVEEHLVHARKIFKGILGNDFKVIESELNACLDHVIVNPCSYAQTVYGYRETPIVIMPSLRNVWHLLILVHELTHAVQLSISAEINDIDDFIPEEEIAETVANAFQFSSLEYIAGVWGGDMAKYMVGRLLLFGLDKDVPYTKKRATLSGLAISPNLGISFLFPEDELPESSIMIAEGLKIAKNVLTFGEKVCTVRD